MSFSIAFQCRRVETGLVDIKMNTYMKVWYTSMLNYTSHIISLNMLTMRLYYSSHILFIFDGRGVEAVVPAV